MAEATSVNGVLDRLDEAGRGGRVSVGDIVEGLGSRGYGPFLFVPAILEISPVGVVPGVPTVLATIVVIFALQIAAGRDHLWLPDLLRRPSVSGDRMRSAVRKLRGVARVLDRWFHERLARLVTPRAVRVAAVACMLMALMVPPLELVPFASSAPMAAIAVFGLAITVRDGLLMALGFGVALIAVAGGFGLLGR